jgi:hypothetical protein
MTTASETLANIIVKRLVEGGLITEADAGKIAEKVAREKMKPEDWRIAIEKGIDAGERR